MNKKNPRLGGYLKVRDFTVRYEQKTIEGIVYNERNDEEQQGTPGSGIAL